MEPNEKQPGGFASRLIPSRLSRDSMILVAALAFLALTILLAIFFPSGGPGTPVPTGTAVAQRGTTPTSTGRATTSAPSPGETASPASPFPGEASPFPTVPQGPYPGPGLTTPQGGNGGEPSDETPSAEGTAGPDGALPTPDSLPTFAPSRPTSDTGGALPTPGGSFFQPTTAYPGPGNGNLQPTEEQPTEPTDTPEPPQPTQRPQPRPQPTAVVPTAAPRPTSPPAAGGGTGPSEPGVPAAPPVDVIRGNVRWTAAKSPIILTRDQQLAPGASLVIEPGVEVRLAPGVSFFVDGALYAIGQPGRPVRFVSTGGQRWEGLVGRPGSDIALEQTEIHGGGAGGTVLSSEGGNLVLRNAHINDNGGHISVSGSGLEVRDSEIAGNDLPYGAALDVSYLHGGTVTLINNRIGGNRMSPGAPPVQINNQSASDVVNLDIQRNLLIGQDGPDLVLSTNGPFQGGLSCNALMNGTNGLSIRSQTLQVPGFNLSVHDNAIEDHTPPIVPIYTQPYHGIGRGATSEVDLDMRNNWWGSSLGPYHPDLHPGGRGEAVGDNIIYDPWLTSRPACAPTP